MARIVSRCAYDPATLATLVGPRQDIVREVEERPDTGALPVATRHRFVAVEGPFDRYERIVTLSLDRTEIVEETTYRLAVPYFGFLFALPVRRVLARRASSARLGPDGSRAPGSGTPWWAPPERLSARASNVLGVLAVVSLIVGYLNTLLTQTVSFAAKEFGESKGAQGASLTIVRCGIVIAPVLMARADRHGRRRVLLTTAIAAPLVGAVGALSPSLWVLTATQAVGRPLALALGLVVGVVAVEEMPKGARAYAVSLVAMATGLGAGICVISLPLADTARWGWRLVYVVPLVFLGLLRGVARRLPESQRFERPHAAATMQGHGRRFVLLALSGLLTNLLIAPASGFQNRFLNEARGFSATRIALFTLATGLPGGLGVVAGGKLADVYGRRIIGAVGVAVAAVGSVLSFASHGWPMWLWASVAAGIGGMSIPALGVYSGELFPTGVRNRANGWLLVLTLTGSSVGLVTAGWLLDRWDYAPTMALLAIGPLVVAVLVVALYPETAHLELEELNPEDQEALATSVDPPQEAPLDRGGPRRAVDAPLDAVAVDPESA